MSVDWHGLYAIVDPDHCRNRPVLDVVGSILDGGCAVVQLRAKSLTDERLLDLGHVVRDLCRQHGVPFVINDRPDIAAALECDGLHLGQSDMPIGQARALVGEMLIGLSTHNLEQAQAAVSAGADLIGFGPVFTTTSKRDPDPVVGLDGLRAACTQSMVPVVAIGGMTTERAEQAFRAGAQLVAVISALGSAPDPGRVAREIHRAAGGEQT